MSLITKRPAPSGARSGSGRRTVAVVTAGLALCSAAWVVAGTAGLTALHLRGTAAAAFLLGVPVTVGAAVGIAAGASADRYGARRVLAGLTAVTAAATALASAGSITASLIGAVVTLSAAGGVLPTGAALLARTAPPGRRGLRLSVFAVGGAAAAPAAGLLHAAVPGLAPHRLAWVLSGLLAAYAVLAATTLRDAPVATRPAPIVRDAAAVLRTPAGQQWSLLYAVATGPLVAMVVYLVAGLPPAGYRPWGEATALIAALVAVAVVAGPAGARTAAAGDPARRVSACYLVAGVLGVVVALDPPRQVTVAALVVAAAALGTAGGAVLYRIGRAAPPERTGLVIGVVGACAALGGLLPPALIWADGRLHGRTTVGVMLLAGVSVAVAGHLRRRRDWVNPLAFPLLHTPALALEPPQVMPNGTSVVALTADDTDRDPAGVLSILTELATRHELVVVYRGGDDARTPARLIAAVRDRLPRHRIAGVVVDVDSPDDSAEWALLGDLLADGAVAVAVTDAADLHAAARAVAYRVGADAVHQLTVGPERGVELGDLPSPVAPDTPARPLLTVL